MAEFKDRSLIFKILYVLLFIITFPIFLLLFILRHPLWVLLVLLFVGGFAVYYPLNAGIKFDDIPAWYQKKYVDWKYEAVLKARQEGVTKFIPQSMLDEVEKIEEEAKEAKFPKGENYNNKVVRSAESEELKHELKQRRGFKKKENSEHMIEEDVAIKENSESSVVPEIESDNSDVSATDLENKKVPEVQSDSSKSEDNLRTDEKGVSAEVELSL